MFRHHMTKYSTENGRFIVSWLQINILGFCWCFSKRQTELNVC